MYTFEKVLVTRNEAHKQMVRVPKWEIPILQAIHGQNNVNVTGEKTLLKRAVPEPGAERDRLILKYGKDREMNMTFVEIVYGNGARGVEQLAQAIAKADEPVTAEDAAIEDLVGTVEGSAAL